MADIRKEKIINLLYFLCLLVAITGSSIAKLLPACDQCSNPVPPSSKTMVADYCHDQGLTLSPNKRCCLSSTIENATDTSIIAIDLRDCELQNVSGIFQPLTSLVLVTLENNPLKNILAGDFYGLEHLVNLSLPANGNLTCPGEENVWRTQRKENDSLLCLEQLNTCHNSLNNETCPSPQSQCSVAGPGLVDCFCDSSYYGYKCLRQGDFPLISYISSICGSTVVMSLLLWLTQRRNVK